jgi:hypothetical protein
VLHFHRGDALAADGVMDGRWEMVRYCKSDGDGEFEQWKEAEA